MRIKVGVTDKNLYIDFLRIILTMAVCLHNFILYSNALPYGGGYIAVDCFFIISGYYLSRHLIESAKGKEESMMDYVRQRYKRLFPEYILAFVIALIYHILSGEISFKEWFGYVREALMIEIWGIDIIDRINPPDWYCGYLLIAYIVAFAYIRWSQKYKGALCITAFLTLVMYFIMAMVSSHINIYPQHQSILSTAVWRAIAGVLLGYLIYLLAGKTCSIIRSRKRMIFHILMFLLEVVLLYILFWENFLPYIDYTAVFFFGLLFYLAINMEMKCISRKLRGIIEYLGELSFSIYLNHYLIAFIFNKYSWFRSLDWKIVSLLFLAIVFIFSNMVFGMRKVLFKF